MTRIHLSFHTSDLDAARAYYTILFGAGPDKVRDDYLRFEPEGAPISLAIKPGVPEPGPEHLGLKMSDAAATKAVWQRLVDADLPLRTQDAVTCCWAVANKVWSTDPDGRAWEVYTVLDDAPATRDGEAASVCCA